MLVNIKLNHIIFLSFFMRNLAFFSLEFWQVWIEKQLTVITINSLNRPNNSLYTMLSLLCHDKHHKLTTRGRTPRPGAIRPPRLSLCLSEMHEAEWGQSWPHRNAEGRICARIKMREVYVHRHHKERERKNHTYITVWTLVGSNRDKSIVKLSSK